MARSNKHDHGGTEVDHAAQLPRLRRIEGQVRGLHQMIENNRNCVDVVNQISAVTAALRRVQSDMLRDHIAAITEAAINGDIPAAEKRRLADEVGVLLTKLG